MNQNLICIGILAFVLAIVGISISQNALDTASTNNVLEVVVNNTNLAPNVPGHPFGTGERISGAIYWTNTSPIQILLFAHADTAGQNAQINLSINGTQVLTTALRPAGVAENTYSTLNTIIPKSSYYQVDLSNYHHYEWREYPILSGKNGTLSISQYLTTNNITNVTNNITNDNATINPYSMNGSNITSGTISKDRLDGYYVNKSGDNMTGTLLVNTTFPTPNLKLVGGQSYATITGIDTGAPAGSSTRMEYDFYPTASNGLVEMNFFRRTNTSGMTNFNILYGNNTNNINTLLGGKGNSYFNALVGGVAIGKTTVTSGYKLDVSGNITAANFNPNQSYSYLVYKYGSVFYAKNGTTGIIDYSNSTASNVIQYAINTTDEHRTVYVTGDLNITSGLTVLKRINLIFDGYVSVDNNVSFITYGDVNNWVKGGSLTLNEVDGLNYSGKALVFKQSTAIIVNFHKIKRFDTGIYFDPVGIGSGENAFYGGWLTAGNYGIDFNTTGSALWVQGNRFYMSIYAMNQYGFRATGTTANDMQLYVGTIDNIVGVDPDYPTRGGGQDIYETSGGHIFLVLWAKNATISSNTFITGNDARANSLGAYPTKDYVTRKSVNLETITWDNFAVVQGTWVFTSDNNQNDYDDLFIPAPGVRQSTDHNNLDEIKVSGMLFNAGIYEIKIVYAAVSNTGILEVLHGTTSIGTQDTYSAITTYNQIATFTYSPTSRIVADFRIRVNSKNVASSNYYLDISRIQIRKTS